MRNIVRRFILLFIPMAIVCSFVLYKDIQLIDWEEQSTTNKFVSIIYGNCLNSNLLTSNSTSNSTSECQIVLFQKAAGYLGRYRSVEFLPSVAKAMNEYDKNFTQPAYRMLGGIFK
jgi:biotin transporter BioY